MKAFKLLIFQAVILLVGGIPGGEIRGQSPFVSLEDNLLYRQSRTALEAGLTREAVAALEAALAGEPDNPALRYKLAETYYEAGEYAAASGRVSNCRRGDTPSLRCGS